jgi:hypothetical protein
MADVISSLDVLAQSCDELANCGVKPFSHDRPPGNSGRIQRCSPRKLSTPEMVSEGTIYVIRLLRPRISGAATISSQR